MNKKQILIEYVSTAQDLIEKSASEKQAFTASLTSKLNAMVNAGSMTSAEAHTIIKEAAQNPANVLNYLDIPTYHQKIASLSHQMAASEEIDPLEQFVNS